MSNDKGAASDDGVNRPLDDVRYEPVMPEETIVVNGTSHYSSPHSVPVGAKAIQWKWWALALGVSIALWWVIARMLGLL